MNSERQKVCSLLDIAKPGDQSCAPPTCPICFEVIDKAAIFRLDCGHIFCSDCMGGHCNAVDLPVCPDLNCDYRLIAEEVGRAGGKDRLQDFCDLQLQQVVEQLPGQVACPNPNCKNVFECEPGLPTHVACECGWPAFCSCCLQLYHGQRRSCSEVGTLRERWAQWVTEGRQQYHGRRHEAMLASEGQRKAVQDNLRSQRELEQDEQWKADHCRCCPSCGRVVQKLEGCDLMRCGSNFHGGNQQKGCGSSFKWSQAPRYTPRVERRPVAPVDFSKLQVEGRGIRHLMVMCDGCMTMHFRGPRLRCVHCPEFNLCLDCDIQGSAAHPADHVFEIMFAAESAHNLDLPDGTEVELIGFSQHAALNTRRGFVRRFQPGRDCYDVELHGEAYVVPEMVKEAPRQPKEHRGLWQVVETWMGLQVERQQLAAESVLPSEPELVPGARIAMLQNVPACFVQVAEGVTALVLQTLDAAEAQRAARMLRWTALPEGQSVRLFGTALIFGRLRDFDGDAATVTGPYLLSTGCFQVVLKEGGDVDVEVPAACVQPLVGQQQDLAVLHEFQSIQDQAQILICDLPVGQRVEILDGPWQGRVAVTATSCCAFEEQLAFEEGYAVRLVSAGPAPTTPHARVQALMAEEYSVSDVIRMEFEQLADLWDLYGLPRDGFVSPDDFVEQSLGFLPETPSKPVRITASQLRPIVSDLPELSKFRLMMAGMPAFVPSSLGDAGPAGPPVGVRALSARISDRGLSSGDALPAPPPSAALVEELVGPPTSVAAAAAQPRARMACTFCSSGCFAALRSKWR